MVIYVSHNKQSEFPWALHVGGSDKTHCARHVSWEGVAVATAENPFGYSGDEAKVKPCYYIVAYGRLSWKDDDKTIAVIVKENE